jgi:FkbM family methyltransferase
MYLPASLRRKAKRVISAVITGNRKTLGLSYDHLFRNATGSITLDIPDFEGRFTIDLKSNILREIVISGTYEPATAQFISRHVDPGRDAVDVGANVGLFTMKMLAAGARRVLAVEPMPRTLQFLKQNILDNGRTLQVILHPGAAGEERGETEIHYIPGKEEYSSLYPLSHPAIKGMETRSLTVQAETLDSLIAASNLDPAIVKIDTEGSEHRVLSGARNMMNSSRPILIMEKWAHTNGAADAILSECGYATRPFGVETVIAAHRSMRLPE